MACGRMAICPTCRIARSAEKTVSGAEAGTGRGGTAVRTIDHAQRKSRPAAAKRRLVIYDEDTCRALTDARLAGFVSQWKGGPSPGRRRLAFEHPGVILQYG